MEPVFIGLDGEMSGMQPGVHSLVQIGVALSDADCFCSAIGWPTFEYDPEALAVAGMSVEQVKAGPPAAKVDEELVAWLAERAIREPRLIAVGWGVSTFDLPFVTRTLPRFSQLLSHHTVELNAVCYTLAGAKAYLDHLPDRAAWKKMSQAMAALHLGLSVGAEPKWHDAGYDAKASLAAWRWLQQVAASPSLEFRGDAVF